MNKPSCEACNGNGWLFANTGNDQSPCYQVQRCDACEQYESDEAALEAVVRLARSHPDRRSPALNKGTMHKLLKQITPLPWRAVEMDNDKVVPSVRIFGRRKHDPSKEICLGRLDSVRDARYAVHAANVLPELVAAAQHLQQNWEKNLTESMARLRRALVTAETIKPLGTPTPPPGT